MTILIRRAERAFVAWPFVLLVMHAVACGTRPYHAALPTRAALFPPQTDVVAPGKALKAAIQHYKDALARARWSPGASSLGALYSQARLFGPDRTPELAAETKDYLETASPEQKKVFFADLAGLRFLPPDDTPIPDLPFFLDLTHVSRETESRTFFVLVQRIYTRAFTRPYEDKAGCARLGAGEVVGVARRLHSAESHLPHFKSLLATERAAVLKALTTTCACLGPEDSERELKSFISAFPKDPAVPTLSDQIAKIEARDPSLRFRCSGGALPETPSPSPGT
jgi:hypothetical protein